MAFYLADSQDSGYREIEATPSAARTKGQAEVIQDVFGFYITPLAANQEGAFSYWARQVRADKATGSGESFTAGDFVYYVVATGLVTPSPTGTIGTDYYFCGVAKRDAGETDDTVLMHFWGDEYNHADRAA